jgi:Concanavalin A-like lectin/glucanases superfamily
MTTVTGMTASRMMEIEAASVVDGDVVGDELILTRHDGQQINAGSVRGPQGIQGPIGSDLSVVTAQPILDVGIINQIRAGRQLSADDFTNMGLSAPLGLWNLSNLTDASGNGRNLLNKGSVPFTSGINGSANTAAQFAGSTTQALYVADTGANDPFRIKTGSWGCWFKTAKTGVDQMIFGKDTTITSNRGWFLYINNGSNSVGALIASADGNSASLLFGGSFICDDRWHFVVATNDGSILRIYVDSVPESMGNIGSCMYGSSAPLNIGGRGADGSTAAGGPFFGKIDEVFVTSDVLTEDEIRNLYCAKISHTLAAIPNRVALKVCRRRRGAALASSDFPTQPLRLYNFSAGAVTDQGSSNVSLTSARTGVNKVAGADGTRDNAYFFNGLATTDFASSDADLPNLLNTRSYGCWAKTLIANANCAIMSWGDTERIWVGSSVVSRSGADDITVPYFIDGLWHFLVVVEENAPVDGLKHKFYYDGNLVGSTVNMASLTRAGANGFRVGAWPDGSGPFNGYIDGVFVCNYALNSDTIRSLYAKGTQALPGSPKNSGDHVEAVTATDLLVTFDTLDSQYQVDLAVA